MQTDHSLAAMEQMPAYKIGDNDQRPWGGYIVVDVGMNNPDDEYCERLITVKPGSLLSLQSHEMRHETWTVERGALTVILDGRQFNLTAGQSIDVPPGALHTMANLGDSACIVREKQLGTCREDDVRRYVDAYGRLTQTPVSPAASKCITLYELILSDINRMAA